MDKGTQDFFKRTLTALDWFIVNENSSGQPDASVEPIPRQKLKIVGETGALLVQRPSRGTIGMLVEVMGQVDHRVRRRLSELLLEGGLGLEVSEEQADVSEGGSWSKFFDSPRLEVEVARFSAEENEGRHDEVVEKTLQRLNFEKILLTPGVTPRRARVTLTDILEAGKNEPRIYEVLPAILRYKPQMIHGVGREIKKLPDLEKAREDLLNTKTRKPFFGVAWDRCVRAAQTYKKYLDQKRTRQKSTMMTLRLSPAELEMLRRLKQKMGTRSVSEAMLQVARERLLGPS